MALKDFIVMRVWLAGALALCAASCFGQQVPIVQRGPGTSEQDADSGYGEWCEARAIEG